MADTPTQWHRTPSASTTNLAAMPAMCFAAHTGWMRKLRYLLIMALHLDMTACGTAIRTPRPRGKRTTRCHTTVFLHGRAHSKLDAGGSRPALHPVRLLPSAYLSPACTTQRQMQAGGGSVNLLSSSAQHYASLAACTCYAVV